MSQLLFRLEAKTTFVPSVDKLGRSSQNAFLVSWTGLVPVLLADQISKSEVVSPGVTDGRVEMNTMLALAAAASPRVAVRAVTAAIAVSTTRRPVVVSERVMRMSSW